jgi:hypothetical protein
MKVNGQVTGLESDDRENKEAAFSFCRIHFSTCLYK